MCPSRTFHAIREFPGSYASAFLYQKTLIVSFAAIAYGHSLAHYLLTVPPMHADFRWEDYSHDHTRPTRGHAHR
jgi:hypothetical protein